VSQPTLHPVSRRGGHKAQRHDEPRAAEHCCHGGRDGGQGTCHHPTPIWMRRLDQGVETDPGLVDLHLLLGDLSHQRLKALQPGQIGRTHLDAAHHGHRISVRTSVVGHRDGCEGHIDMNRTKPVGIGEPQNRRDHVGGRGAGGQQRLTDAHGKVDDGAGCSLVDAVRTQPQGEHVGWWAALPHSLPGPLTKRPPCNTRGSRRTGGGGGQ